MTFDFDYDDMDKGRILSEQQQILLSVFCLYNQHSALTWAEVSAVCVIGL